MEKDFVHVLWLLVKQLKNKKLVKIDLCPCTPALTNEIPTKGSCHCGIFCTNEKALEIAKENNTHDAIATHSRGLTKEECEKLLNKSEVNSH
jgi:ferredoxin-thioredoxin reductase catalytic subunit